MKVLPFGNYQPDPRRGEVSAHDHTLTDINGEVFFSYAAVWMSWSGDSCSIDRGYSTLAEAEAAAYQEARRRNAVFPSNSEGAR